MTPEVVTPMYKSPYPVSRFLAECTDPTVIGTSSWKLLSQHSEVCANRRVEDILAKQVLSHTYGERMAIVYRNWVRAQLPEDEELPCGGSSADFFDTAVA